MQVDVHLPHQLDHSPPYAEVPVTRIGHGGTRETDLTNARRIMTIFKAILFLSILQLSLSAVQKRNNYDPHVPFSGSDSWFEGWYTRIVDVKNGRSFASCAGSFCAGGKGCDGMSDQPGYLAFIHQDHNENRFQVEEMFPEHTKITLGQPPSSIDENPNSQTPARVFTWQADGVGLFTNESIKLNMPEKNIRFTAEMTDPVYWDTENPGEGPEGIVSYFPLQQHWFVYSLRSQVKYVYNGPQGTMIGTGYAHQEKNWGSSFPSEWVWLHGISQDGNSQLVLSGGNVPIVGGLSVHAWLVGLRSEKYDLDFRPQDLPTLFVPEVDACNGKFKMDVTHLTQRLIIEVAAPVDTFVDLAIPTANGFVKNGCVESYSAKITVSVYSWGSLVDTIIFERSAIEFGAGYMCQNH
ncbi:hypothetical protein PROFUN_13116 [Planoprotostelium fungivorum]|uniref:AttH domain-containing protein n=1 Tax=Planoprotostelium fungivorum TaxID=1890364 RepID=A0A2P6N5D1_9EUKA|nr:hypothetical protein PROFUN_13116 [Planoprotostelium fungivorum]